jgi:drug/metabolite transporter (DMT)-like permease
MTRAETTGSLAAAGAFVAVGSLVAASDVIEGYPLAAGQTARYAAASALLLALLRLRGPLPRPTGREALYLLGLAATGLVLFNVFVVLGVREGDAATVGVIVGCVPVVLALAGPALEGRPVRPPVVAAAAIVALGAAGVEYGGGSVTALGLAGALGALACEAAFSLLAIPVLARLGALAVSAYACVLAAPMFALWSLGADGVTVPAPSLAEVAAYAYLAVGVTAGGFLLWYTAVALLKVERAGLFSGILPLTALVCSAALGAADITPLRVAAVLVVGAGVTLGVRVGRERPTILVQPEPQHA